MTISAEGKAIMRLVALGARREQLQAEQEQLADDIRQALVETEEHVNRAYAAELLGIERSTLYRVYLRQ